MRGGEPVYDIWGNVHPAYRRRGLGRALLHENLRRSASGSRPGEGRWSHASAGSWRVRRPAIGCFSNPRASPVRYFFLMIRPTRDDIPDAPLPDGHRDQTGPARAPPGDLRGRERSLPGSLEAARSQRGRLRSDVQAVRSRHRPVGRGLGRRRGRGRRPELDLARGEREARPRSRLAGAHQRPPTVAQAGARPGDHGGGAPPARNGRV